MIQPKPYAYLNTLAVVRDDASYTSSAQDPGYLALIQENAADFAGVMWFYPLDSIPSIHSTPSLRAYDDLVTYAGATRANQVRDSYPTACAGILAWHGTLPITYTGQAATSADNTYWQSHIAAGTLESELDRLTAYLPDGAPMAIDGSATITGSSYATNTLDYLLRTRTIYCEASARAGSYLRTRNCPGVITLAAAKNIADWTNYHPRQIILLTQTFVDDIAAPADQATKDANPTKDYGSDLIPLVQLGFYVAVTYHAGTTWLPSWWQTLLDESGLLTLANAGGLDLGNDGGTYTIGAFRKNSTQDITFRIYNRTTSTVTLDSGDPTIGGDASGGSITGGATVLAPGEYNEFSVSLDTSATGSKSATISVTHDGPGSPFTFTLNFRVAVPRSGMVAVSVAGSL